MEIYTVQPGDTIFSIANKYGVSVDRIVYENGLDYTYGLAIGQAILITNPSQTHTVKEGDTLEGIINEYGITLMQMLRNNSFLYDRNFIYPGESLVIRYPTQGHLVTNGYSFAFIKKDTLIRTLPYLSYLSVFNYGANDKGDVFTFGDDTEIIQLAKEYGTAPLMMISALSQKGEVNLDFLYKILLNEEFNTLIINNIIKVMHEKGFYGVNILISDMNTTNQEFYIRLLEKEANLFKKEGYYFTITLNPHIEDINEQISFEQLDYHMISQLVNDISFLQYSWGTNPGPPSPISSAFLLKNFIGYVAKLMPPDRITLGKALLGYDWELPYRPDKSLAYSLSIDSAIALARDFGAAIQFDEVSQTPYFKYNLSYIGPPIEHIVWFVDVRSISALMKLIDEYKLEGSGIWNVTIFYQPMYTLINSQYEIQKVISDNFQNSV